MYIMFSFTTNLAKLTCHSCVLKERIRLFSKPNKNLAIANRSRVSCINTNDNIMTLKSGLEVHSMSLKVVPFKSLGAVSYSTSVVNKAVAVCDIFNVKEWPDLETGLG